MALAVVVAVSTLIVGLLLAWASVGNARSLEAARELVHQAQSGDLEERISSLAALIGSQTGAGSKTSLVGLLLAVPVGLAAQSGLQARTALGGGDLPSKVANLVTVACAFGMLGLAFAPAWFTDFGLQRAWFISLAVLVGNCVGCTVAWFLRTAAHLAIKESRVESNTKARE
jgi:hypothetical protein